MFLHFFVYPPTKERIIEVSIPVEEKRAVAAILFAKICIPKAARASWVQTIEIKEITAIKNTKIKVASD